MPQPHLCAVVRLQLEAARDGAHQNVVVVGCSQDSAATSALWTRHMHSAVSGLLEICNDQLDMRAARCQPPESPLLVISSQASDVPSSAALTQLCDIAGGTALPIKSILRSCKGVPHTHPRINAACSA